MYKYGCWFDGDTNLTADLERLLAPVANTSSIILVPVKSRMETFVSAYRDCFGKWPLNECCCC